MSPRDPVRPDAPQTPVAQYREMDLRVDHAELKRRRAARAADAGAPQEPDPEELIPVALSSEKPVLRYDWWQDEKYYEVLDHSAASVDMAYARDGLPFVMSHRSWDGDSQHGIVEQVAVDKDRVLRGEIRMSRAERSQEIADDILRGIRKKVSVGYIVGDEYEQTPAKAKDGIPTRRYTAWMPIELSVVPVPADYDGSGFGRSASGDTLPLPQQLQDAVARYLQSHPSHHPKARKAEERTMSAEPTAPAAAPVVTDVRDRGPEVQSRVDNISVMAQQHGMLEKLPGWLKAGASEIDISREINTELAARLKRGPVFSPGVEIPANEKREFFFSRALIAGTELEKELGVDCGFEREIAQEARKNSPTKNGSASFIPTGVVRVGARAGIDSGTSSTGGPFKFTQPGDFIPLLRNKMAIARLGATFLSGLTGPVTFPKQLAAATGSWIGENPLSDTADSNLTMTTVSLAFKTLMSTTSVSRQALFSAVSGNYDLDALIRDDLARVIALAIDLAGITGSGSSNQPLGILNNTSVGTAAALGANGGTMAWGNWVDLETAIGDANADLPGMGYLSNTKQRGVGKKTAILGNTASGVTIWQNTPGEMDGIVNGYKAVASNQVSRTLTKGTAAAVCSAVIFGAWPNLLIGQFGNGFEVLVDPLRLKKQAMIELTAFTFADVALRYPEAFATLKDAL